MQFKKETFINTFSLALFLLSIFILLFFPKTITFASTTAGCGEYWGGNWTIPANTYCGVLNEVIAVSKHLVLQPGSTLELNGTTNLIFGFKYRIPITISNPGAALTNYTINVTLDTASLISAGKMRNDCGDIEFGDADLNGYPYWIEEGTCNTANTRIWVKLTTIPAGSKQIYMFYGNPTATSISNGSKVFLFFDDFSTADTSKFTYGSSYCGYNPLSYSVSNGKLTVWSDGASWRILSQKAYNVTTVENVTVVTKFNASASSSWLQNFFVQLDACDQNRYGWQNVWLKGWQYRKPITINNTQNSNTLTNYQVLVTLDTQSLISAGKMQPYCNDTRFTDSDGNTLLSYWIESGCNTTSTKFWVNVTNIPASSTKTIYVYYGNSSATSASNGTATFVKFFDFNSGTGQNCYSPGSWQWRCDYPGNFSYFTGRTSGGVYGSNYTSVAYEGAYSINSTIGDTSAGYYLDFDAEFNFTQFPTPDNYLTTFYLKTEASGSETSSNFVITQKYSTIWENVTIHNINQDWTRVQAITNSSYSRLRIFFRAHTSTTGATSIQKIWVDNVFIAKYTSPEPTTSVGNEETNISWNIQMKDGTGYTYSSTITTLTANTWYIDEIRRNSTGCFRGKIYNSSWSLLGSHEVCKSVWSGVTWTWVTWQYQTTQVQFDWLFIRKATPIESLEPTATVGTEESNLPQYIYIYSGGKLYIYPPAGINKP
jgi:hypothetical protein